MGEKPTAAGMGERSVNGLTLIDTDILIDAAHQINEATNHLNQIEQRSWLAISIITQMELVVGCRNKTELQKTERFLQRFQILKINEPICDHALEILQQDRLSHGLAIPDALIAATAITLNIPLLSKNQRDYRFISSLQLLPFPEISLT